MHPTVARSVFSALPRLAAAINPCPRACGLGRHDRLGAGWHDAQSRRATGWWWADCFSSSSSVAPALRADASLTWRADFPGASNGNAW